MLFTVKREKLCRHAKESVSKIKARPGGGRNEEKVNEASTRIIDAVTSWWSTRLREANDAENPDIENNIDAYLEVMRTNLIDRAANEFSESQPVGLFIDEGGCGGLNGALAVYAGVAEVDIILPEGFAPGGLEMLITPHAAMIVESVWHYETDERVEGYDTRVVEFLSCEEPNPVISAVARWLIDYVIEYVDYDDPEANDDNRDERKGNLDELYEQVATRLRTVDFAAVEAATWQSDDLVEIIRAAGSPIPAPRNVAMSIEKDRVAVQTPGGVEFVVFGAEEP